MRFVQTLYIDKAVDPFKNSFGWAAPEYHLMGWALSCLQLCSFYKKVSLFCNGIAAELLVDQLGLPYTTVYETHEGFFLPDESLWALPKILTYSLQTEPFIHVDGDVFIFDELPKSLLTGDLIAQNKEEATNYYLSCQNELMKHFTYLPECVRSDFYSGFPINAVNAGIIGGNNLEFITEYASTAFDYVNRNLKHLDSVSLHRFNVFFEQHLFYSMATSKNIPINFLFQDINLDNQYTGLSDFHEVPFKKYYCHLLGQYKKDYYTCAEMAAKLRQLYPEHYYEIISLCKKKKVYLTTRKVYDHLDALPDYLRFNQASRFQYVENLKGDCIVDEVRESASPPEPAEIEELTFLETFIDKISIQDLPFDVLELRNDFESFSKKLRNSVQSSMRFSQEYLYGRDLDSDSWFCELFQHQERVFQKVISRCPEIDIISSHFDWAGLANQHKRVGVRYYEELELTRGNFYNLFVPEVSDEGFSLHDLDDMEKTILDELTLPMTVKDLFGEMQKYVDDDVVSNYLFRFHDLLVVLVKRLVLKKALRPHGPGSK